MSEGDPRDNIDESVMGASDSQPDVEFIHTNAMSGSTLPSYDQKLTVNDVDDSVLMAVKRPNKQKIPKKSSRRNRPSSIFGRSSRDGPLPPFPSSTSLFMSESQRIGGSTSKHYRMKNIGIVQHLAEGNFLSMQWYKVNDTTERQKDPCGFVTALLLSCFGIVCYMLLFTHFTETRTFSLDRNKIGDNLLYVAFGLLPSSLLLLFLTYVLDLHNGGLVQQRISSFLYLLAGSGLFVSIGFTFTDQVIVPMAIYCLAVPLVCGSLKKLLFPRMDSLLFIVGLMLPLWIAVGVMLVVIGIVDAARPWSNLAVRAVFERQVGCSMSGIDAIAAQKLLLDIDCLNENGVFSPCGDLLELGTSRGRAFNTLVGALVEESEDILDLFSCYARAQFLYLGPGIFVLIGSFFLWLMKELVKVSLVDRENRRLSNISSSFQAFLLLTGISILSAWIALSILDEEVNVKDAAVSAATLLLIFVGVVVGVSVNLAYSVLGSAYIAAQLNRTPIGKRLYVATGTSLVRAAAVYFLAPVYFLWALLSVPTQFLRKHTFLGKKLTTPAEKKLFTKQEVVQTWEVVRSWDLGHMLHGGMIIGMFYFGMVVFIGRFTTVLLAVLRQSLESVSLPVATLAFILIGLTMFLLPPVPGLPVYLAGGVILFSNARNGGMDDITAMIYAVAANFLLKLLAVAAEQKILGEWIGSRSVRIRSMCGINSPSLKAIAYILKSNKLVAKVAILCGGPDWPTSVLTGILKQKLWQMLLGTVPVILLVICSTAAGAFLVLDPSAQDTTNSSSDKSSNIPIKEIRAVLLAATIVVQAVFFLLAFHEIGKVVDYNPEAIAAIPDDLEVLEYDRENKERNDLKKELQSWDKLDPVFKKGHMVAVLLFIVTNWTFQFGSSVCFKTIEPTDKAQMPFEMAGWVVLGVFLVPVVYFFIFQRVINNRVSAALNSGQF